MVRLNRRSPFAVRDQLFRASVLFAIATLLVLPNPPAGYAQPYESSEVWCKAYNSDPSAVSRCIEAEKRMLLGPAYPYRSPPQPGAAMPPANNFPGPSGVVLGQPGQAPRSTSGGEDRFAALPPDLRPESGTKELPPRFRRTLVDYQTKEPPGTLIVDTKNTYLYLVLEKGKAMRYGIGAGARALPGQGRRGCHGWRNGLIGIHLRK